MYDIISMREQPTQECYEDTQAIVNEVLQNESAELISNRMLYLYEKHTLSNQDLQQIKLSAQKLEQKHLHVQIFKNEERIFWTKNFIASDFCLDFSSSPFTGQICYSPFNEDGTIDASHLQEMGFHHYFIKASPDSHYKIKGVPVSMGKHFRTKTEEYILLGGYLLALLW